MALRRSAGHPLSLNRLYHGNTRELVCRLPDKSIAVTITSPPYAGLKDYGVDGQIGWGQDYHTYMRDLIGIFREIHRATRETGSLWIVLDTFKVDGQLQLLPFDFTHRIQSEVGWILQDLIIWDKGKTLPWSRAGQLRNQFEYLLCFSKGKSFKYEIDRLKEIELKEWWVRYPERYNPKGKVPSNIWSLQIPVQGAWSNNGLRHACPFPLILVERILLLTTDRQRHDVALDPFAGSGIVLALARQMGRGYVGFELNRHFIEMYRTKVRTFVKRDWKARSNKLRTIEGQRRALQQQIWKLRLTKYPKALYKEMQDSMGEELPNVMGIIALSKQKPAKLTLFAKRHHILSLRILIIFDKLVKRAAIEQCVKNVMSVPPLSKFGIDATVALVNWREVYSAPFEFGLWKARPVWIYRKGRTNKHDGKTTISRWLEEIKESYCIDRDDVPLIACNIQVSQDIVRTWFPRSAHQSRNSPGAATVEVLGTIS